MGLHPPTKAGEDRGKSRFRPDVFGIELANRPNKGWNFDYPR